MDQPVATLIAASMATATTIVISFFGKEELKFWKKTRTIKLGGSFDVLCRLHENELEPVIGNDGLVQVLDNCSLKIKGESAALTSDYTLNRNGVHILTGKFSANGILVGENAFMIYKIESPDKQKKWAGVLVININQWDDHKIYLLNKSQLVPGRIGLLYGKLLKK